jgi:hypothetical protein
MRAIDSTRLQFACLRRGEEVRFACSGTVEPLLTNHSICQCREKQHGWSTSKAGRQRSVRVRPATRDGILQGFTGHPDRRSNNHRWSYCWACMLLLFAITPSTWDTTRFTRGKTKPGSHGSCSNQIKGCNF